MKTGEQQVGDAVIWIKWHPEEWKRLQETCLRIEAAQDEKGRKRFSGITCGSVYMLAQMVGIEVTNDCTFKRNKSLWSTLARYLVQLHPQLKRVIETRDCEVGRYVNIHGLPELGPEYVYKVA